MQRIDMYPSKLFLTVLCTLLTLALSAQTVYITKTGEKYHSSSCHYLRFSSIAIDIEDAIEKGYDACSVCKPSSKSENNSTISDPGEKEENNNAGSEYQRCSATTQAGTRCKRITKNKSGKCWQHE